MPKLPEALEIEYLRYFFDQVNLMVQERYFIEEGFEICFQKSVPSSMKMRTSSIVIPESPKTPNIPPPPNNPKDFEKLLAGVDSGSYIVVDKNTGENLSLSMLISKLKILSEMKE